MFGNEIKRWCKVALGGVVFLVQVLFCIITIIFRAITTVFANLTFAGSQITVTLDIIIETLCEKAKAY